jgi:hypothetical protein
MVMQGVMSDALFMAENRGDHPFGKVKINDDAIARDNLPTWFMLGQAEPPISDPWWMLMLKQRMPDHMEPQFGKRIAIEELQAFDKKMLKLYNDSRYTLYVLMYAPPELRDYFAFMKRAGLHTGRLSENLREHNAA